MTGEVVQERVQRKEREAGLIQVGASEQGAQHLTHLTICNLHFYSGLFEPGISSNTWQNRFKDSPPPAPPWGRRSLWRHQESLSGQCRIPRVAMFRRQPGKKSNLKIKNVFVFFENFLRPPFPAVTSVARSALAMAPGDA